MRAKKQEKNTTRTSPGYRAAPKCVGFKVETLPNDP